jgi:hypothetical protein
VPANEGLSLANAFIPLQTLTLINGCDLSALCRVTVYVAGVGRLYAAPEKALSPGKAKPLYFRYGNRAAEIEAERITIWVCFWVHLREVATPED